MQPMTIQEIAAAVEGVCRVAGIYSFIVRLVFGSLAVSVAMHECYNVLRRLYFNAEKSTNGICRILGTGNAEIRLCLARCNSESVVVTALVATSTAVDAGQACSY